MSSAQRLYATDETFREVADLLYGGGADELIAKLSPEKSKKDRTKENIALATNTAGAVAGPAAIYQAYRGRKGGGMPRDAMKSGKLGGRMKRIGEKLDNPRGRKAKYGAAAAGASMVGLQVANMAGDTIAAQHFADQKKKEKLNKRGGRLVPISKAEPGSSDLSLSTGKLKRIAAKKAYEQSEDHLAVGKGRLKRKFREGTGKPSFEQHPAEVNGKKIKKSDDVTWEGEFSKVDTDKRQVFGWASIVEINGEPVVDLQGDYIDHDELEKSAYEYVVKSRKGGNMHLRNGDEPVHVSDMIESFIVTPEKKEKLGLPDSMPTGWWVGYQINDDDAWNLVKSGKRTGFSIHGRGQRTPMEL